MPRPSSADLHRAKRARERATMDSTLMDADTHLDDIRHKMTTALVAVMQHRHVEAMTRITEALGAIDSARRFLIGFYDNLGSKDDEG